MSSTSRPQTSGTSNIQSGQSPSKPSQESTNPSTNNVAQPLYQNNPNQQFLPNSIPLINQAQQLQFQSQLQQTAAFLQRQSLLHQHQQQQQPNPMDSQMKTQQMNNGPLGTFHNLPDLLNFFLMTNPGLNLPQQQLNPTTSLQQQPLQTPKTVPVSPSKSVQSQHSPRSTTIGSRSAATNSAQTAELNSVTSAIPSSMLSEPNAESSKQLLTPSPNKTSSGSSGTSGATPSPIGTDRLLDELKEKVITSSQYKKKGVRDDSPLSNISSPQKDSVQDNVSGPETKSTLPRKKQTNAAGSSPLKTNPIISPSTPPKKSDVAVSSLNPQSTPTANVSAIPVPTTPTTPPNTPDKKAKPTKKATVPKSVKNNDVEVTTSVTDDQKPATSAQIPAQSSIPESVDSEVKTKRNRVQTNLYQSPTPELVWATRMSVSEANKSSNKSQDKLIIFFADEFVAVRNDQSGFYLCQCVNNMYGTSKKCRVRWLNLDEKGSNTYKLAFYDRIDKECILTSVSLQNAENNCYKLMDNERERIDNILKKSIDVEKGILPRPEVTEENPDGLDISLYKNESQIKTDDVVSHKRKSESSSKSVPPSKKLKKNTKPSKGLSVSRRKSKFSNVESPNKNKKTSKQSKKKKIPPAKQQQKVVSDPQSSNVSKSDSSAHMDNGKKKAAKTKKKSAHSSTTSPDREQRTLRTRSNK